MDSAIMKPYIKFKRPRKGTKRVGCVECAGIPLGKRSKPSNLPHANDLVSFTSDLISVVSDLVSVASDLVSVASDLVSSLALIVQADWG